MEEFTNTDQSPQRMVREGKNSPYYCTLSLTCTRYSKKNPLKVLPFAIVLLRKPDLSSAVSGLTVWTGSAALLWVQPVNMVAFPGPLLLRVFHLQFVFPFLTVWEMDHLPDSALCYVLLSTCSYSNHVTLLYFAPHHRWAVGFYHWKDE